MGLWQANQLCLRLEKTFRLNLNCHHVTEYISEKFSSIRFTVLRPWVPVDNRSASIQVMALSRPHAFTLTHWGRDKMAVILADNTFKYKFVKYFFFNSSKMSLKFVSQGPINNIPVPFRKRFGAEQTKSHYLNQWLYSLRTHIYLIELTNHKPVYSRQYSSLRLSVQSSIHCVV